MRAQLGDHTAALAVLALEMGDIRGAEQYCEQQAGPSERLALLRMLLSPGHGREPLYAEACHLLAAQGQTWMLWCVYHLSARVLMCLFGID